MPRQLGFKMLVQYYFIAISITFSYCEIVDKVKPLESLKLLCDMTAPSLATADHNSWKKWYEPAKDNLDRYVQLRTGCTYREFSHGVGFKSRVRVFPPGVALEWQAAVRSRDFAVVEVRPDAESYHALYSFFIGEDNNNITEMYEHATHRYWQKHTPNILNQDRYVPFYLRIKNGTMVFGKLCDPEPLFTLDVPLTVERGDRPRILYWTKSFFGAKYLSDCP